MLARSPMKRGKRNKRLEPTPFEREHMDRVKRMGCVVTGSSACDLHHVMKCPGKNKRRDHRFVVGLIPELHNMGKLSVHLLGSEELFFEVHGTDLAGVAIREWENSCGAMEEF